MRRPKTAHSSISPTKYSRGQTCYIASLPIELLTFVFDEAIALETGPLTLSSVCLHWSRIVYKVPRYWSYLVIRDKFSTQRVKEMLRMAKGHFETIKLYNLFVNDLLRLGKIMRRASPSVKTLYYETTDGPSIHALASLALKPESLIIRNVDLQGTTFFIDLAPLFGATLRVLSLYRSTSLLEQYRHLLGSLTGLSITGFGIISLDFLHDITSIQEIILLNDGIDNPYISFNTRSSISLPSLRVFKLRCVPYPTQTSLPTLRIHAPMLHTFHLESTSAALWLLAFGERGAPAAIVDFRIDQPNGPAMSLSHLQPFLCDTIESFALTSVSHDLGPFLSDIHAGRILPRRRYLEFTFHDD